jgi:hypothetical protein
MGAAGRRVVDYDRSGTGANKIREHGKRNDALSISGFSNVKRTHELQQQRHWKFTNLLCYNTKRSKVGLRKQSSGDSTACLNHITASRRLINEL